MKKIPALFMRLSALFVLMVMLTVSCNVNSRSGEEGVAADQRIPVIFDTDANNELDDQHALAYLFANLDTFNLLGVTTNATPNGGPVEKHVEEAERIFRLFNLEGKIPLLAGANGNFTEIRSTIGEEIFDGSEAVGFIIEKAREYADHELILLAVGKLTNVALALEKAPEIAESITIIWLGSNYPETGEYNEIADTASVNYLLRQEVPMEIVLVRYGKTTGASHVYVQWEDIASNMPGLGPQATAPVTGRHGGTYSHFGDYSVNLFEHAEYYGDPPHRSLFDLVAAAVLKNPSWGAQRTIPAPVLLADGWEDQPDNRRRITLWENFDKSAVLEDFYSSMRESASSESRQTQ